MQQAGCQKQMAGAYITMQGHVAIATRPCIFLLHLQNKQLNSA